MSSLHSSKIILVTGASGFIGRSLVKSLCENGYEVRATVRSASAAALLSDDKSQLNLKNLTIFNLGELTDETDWRAVLACVDTVIHCAARAHILKETSSNPLETFRQMNTRVTAHLAQQAYELNVRRFIFLSSMGVLGRSSHKMPFTDESSPNPQVPYAQAKWEAEQCLHAIPNTLDKVIIRPPLVYGVGVKGNLGLLMTAIKMHIPLPLGAVKNRRQMLGMNNLVDFILTCVQSEKTINDTFLIADKEVVSTTELLNHLADAVGKRAFLLPVSPRFLNRMLLLLGKSGMAEQLLGNFEIKSDKAQQLLGWAPRYSMQEQLRSLRTK